MSSRLKALMVSAMILGCGLARATPSTTYWTPMTVDVQPYGVVHIGADNYFTVFKKTAAGGGSFPSDVGLTVGVLPFKSVIAEVGLDLMEASDNPVFLNAKIGLPEDTLFDGAPTLQVGIFNVGTKKDVTDQNVVYAVVGKSIPNVGRLSAGPYIGNKEVLVDKDGNKENTGFMVAFDRGFLPTKDKDGNEYNQWVFAADYASGDNALGGGGVGVYHFFTKDISVLTGPVWFNEKSINGEWKWTFQLDINL